jgi:betaine reductase
MDMERQGDIQSVVEKRGRDGLVVLLGAIDVDSLALAAETVVSGDPSYAGPLAGVSLGLPVFHILEPALRDEIPPSLYEEKLGLVAMVADVPAIHRALEAFRKNPAEG